VVSISSTFAIRLWSFLKVPLLFAVRPSLVSVDDEQATIRIRLRRRTRNHLGSMYVGALCIGADCAGGLIAMQRIQQHGNQVSLIFQDVQAEFLRRAEGDVFFTCRDGLAISELVRRALESGEREAMPVEVIATVPEIDQEPVARFVLTLSLKRR
jgi:acyl-coenzyme A thioesterase PaaI-like protein